MPVFLKQYLLSLELIGRDVITLYRNFWHWNLSKIVILGACTLLATLLSLPFIGIIWWLVTQLIGSLDTGVISKLLSEGTLDPSAIGLLMSHGWALFGTLISGLMIIGIFVILLSYGYFLLLRIYSKYLDGVRLPLRSNLYWKPAYITKFTAVFGWTTLAILIPSTLWALYFFGLFTLEQTGIIDVKNDLHKQILGVLSLTGLIVTLTAIVYMIVRTMMGNMYFTLWDGSKKPTSTGLSFVKASWELTRGSVARIIFLLIPAIIVTSIMTYGLERIHIERDIANIVERTNKELAITPPKYKSDHEYVNLVLAPWSELSRASEYARDKIASNFAESKLTADKEYIRSIYPFVLEAGSLDKTSDLAWNIGMGIVSFFLLEGAMLMVYFSIFHILRANQSKVPRATESTSTTDKVRSSLKWGVAKSTSKKVTPKSKAFPTPQTPPAKKAKISPQKKAPNKLNGPAPSKVPAKKKPIIRKTPKAK